MNTNNYFIICLVLFLVYSCKPTLAIICDDGRNVKVYKDIDKWTKNELTPYYWAYNSLIANEYLNFKIRDELMLQRLEIESGFRLQQLKIMSNPCSEKNSKNYIKYKFAVLNYSNYLLEVNENMNSDEINSYSDLDLIERMENLSLEIRNMKNFEDNSN